LHSIYKSPYKLGCGDDRQSSTQEVEAERAVQGQRELHETVSKKKKKMQKGCVFLRISLKNNSFRKAGGKKGNTESPYHPVQKTTGMDG
jgi:hypothetical protein